jgi:hypothetical protein
MRKKNKIIIVYLVLIGLLVLILPFIYQALNGLTNLLHWDIPQMLLITVSIMSGVLITPCVYDLLGDSQDLIILRQEFKDRVNRGKQALLSYCLFLKHRHLIKPHLNKIVNEYQKNANLRKKGWKYSCFEEILLEHGVLMFPETQLQKHYSNNNDLVYVEGYTIFKEPDSRLYIFSHAWIATPNQKKALDVLNRNPGTCYYGIAFCPKWIDKVLKQRKQRGEEQRLLFDIRTDEGLYILKYGLPKEALATK